MAMHWYVVKAISGRENKCRDAIVTKARQAGKSEQVGRLLVPSERVTEVKRRGKVTTERKLYPGYIYAECDLDEDLIEVIRNVDGVTGFLGSSPGAPDRLTAEEAERIIAVSTAESVDEQRAVLVQIPYQVGDKVKVKEGTFAGMEGDVDEINEQKGTIRVLITVFGRQTPIELEVWQVEEVG
ncbi:MAG: transcription termination/antitermination factor NusG [Planctomycetota bacterium]|nr:MAG: transcription termination/antitermination factor NusG [Planctomycetota bacterium]